MRTFFTASEIHRLMGNIEDPKLLKGDDLKVCISVIEKLDSKKDYGKNGLPLVKSVNSSLPLDYEGKFTAAQISYTAKKMNPLTDGIKGYAKEVAMRVLEGGRQYNNVNSIHLENGKKREPVAVSKFMDKTGYKLSCVNDDQFVFELDDIDLSSTPDGVREKGFDIDFVVEVKCRKLINHYINFEISDNDSLFELDKKAFYQLQAQMMTTGSKYGYYIIYCPIKNDKYKHLEYKHTKIHADIEIQSIIRERVLLAMSYRDEFLAKYL